MLRDLESDLVERKASLKGDASTTSRGAVCAFANDLPGHGRPGVLFVGANDDGTSSKLDVTDELLLTLAAMKNDGNIVPPPSLTVGKHNLAGGQMAVVTVEPADSPPVSYRGRIHVRVGPSRAIATAQDERMLNERRRHGDRPYDVRGVPSARLDDLNRLVFEGEYLGSAVAPDVLAANDRSYEQRLAATKMVTSADDPVPTVLGLLVLGVRTRDFLPGAYVQFLRVSGTTLADPVSDDSEIDGTVSDVMRRLDEKVQSHNRVAVDFTSGVVEGRTQPYPSVALQQLTRNAVMHRTYEHTNAPVRVSWFDDRIEILSPGGPYGVVTVATFGQPGLADYRNPSLAEAMKVLGFVQRYGAGIPTARRELAANGNPAPEFTVAQTYVNVIIRARL
jgi:ATP-dependent DNA helicase RecG